MRHNNQEFIGVDYGSARVGIARGGSAARLAEPLKTVPVGQAFKAIQELSVQNQAVAVVVGLPRSLDGSDTQQTAAARQWAKKLQAAAKLPVYLQDEALTSAAAAKTADVDATAAAIILQDFLDSSEEERVRC